MSAPRLELQEGLLCHRAGSRRLAPGDGFCWDLEDGLPQRGYFTAGNGRRSPSRLPHIKGGASHDEGATGYHSSKFCRPPSFRDGATPMRREPLAIEPSPLWGWEAVNLTTRFAPNAVVASLGYSDHFPLFEVVSGGITIPSREELECDCDVSALPGPPAVSSLLGSVPREEQEHLLASMAPGSQLILSLRHIVNLPAKECVLLVLEITEGKQPEADHSLDVIRRRASQLHSQVTQSEQAWRYASSIVRKVDGSERLDHFHDFLGMYGEDDLPPGHPVLIIRRDLENAILNSRNSPRYQLLCPEPQRPYVQDFLSDMPVGIDVESGELPTAVAVPSIVATVRGVRPPRCGDFLAIGISGPGNATRWILTWQPHEGQPPFPVVKAAACALVPSILAAPLSETAAPPVLPSKGEEPSESEDSVGIAEVRFPWAFEQADRFRISDLTPLSRDPQDWAREGELVARDIRTHGTDALAWHQGFHAHSERTWGIYFNAPKIDGFVQGVYAAMASAGCWPNFGFLSMAIVEWIGEHEWFHARVEAALTIAELMGGAARYLPYKKNVYRPLAATSDDCLEEALANYTAQESLLRGQNRWAELLPESDRIAMAAALENEMNASPPGYRAWRRGQDVTSWRTLAWQLATASTTAGSASEPPPLEPMLLGPLPYDHQKTDVAWYVYGEGVVMNAVLACPSTFSVPSRRELMKALRFLDYRCDESRGKGSHEMWFRSETSGFSLPRRDPVGRKVFGDFLAHSGLETKARYMAEVRPHI